MRILSLTALTLLFMPGIWSTSNAQALDPAVEQIGLVIQFVCEGLVDESAPPCSDSILMDIDRTHAMPLYAAAWSPDGTRQLFARWVAPTDYDIHVMSATGGISVNLTNDPAYDWGPAWSPDGARIAFVSNRDGPLDLYVMSADGSNVMRIGTGVGMAWKNATWSPDSSRLAFGCIVDGNYDICAINADGSGFARLTSEPEGDYDPDWSPDGASILFATDRYGATELAVMNPDGSDVTQVSPGTQGQTPSWSSDGTRIAFVYLTEWNPDEPWMPQNYVSVINADGTGFGSLEWGYGPVWRPWAGGVNDRPIASFTFDCTTEPTCTFDASPSSDSDGVITSYGWHFGDGTMASGVTATHTFADGYRYGVRLVVMDDDAALGTTVQTVDLNQPPVVSFTATCSGLKCTLDGTASFDSDGSVTSFKWKFGDLSSGWGSALTHTYAAAGTYTVTLIGTDNGGGTSSHSQTVTVVNSPPIASFTYSCDARMCSFDALASSDYDGRIVSHAWNFGDGTTGSGVTTSHTYAAGGTYTVLLTVSDNSAAASTQAQSVIVVARDIHVGDLDGANTSQQSTWTATVTIAIHDSSHGPVANAAVTGSWDNGSAAACTTNASGDCALSRSGIPKKTQSVSFTVTSVGRATFVYEPGANHDADGDSNGTSITVRKP